ncbi:MAG: hypothetical protein J6W70_02025 [Lentisphaeria bacterium]|nr:hypothetical protein [Lentisphaeria bacterium]
MICGTDGRTHPVGTELPSRQKPDENVLTGLPPVNPFSASCFTVPFLSSEAHRTRRNRMLVLLFLKNIACFFKKNNPENKKTFDTGKKQNITEEVILIFPLGTVIVF